MYARILCAKFMDDKCILRRIHVFANLACEVKPQKFDYICRSFSSYLGSAVILFKNCCRFMQR